MPAREFDQAQALTEPSQGSGLDTLEQPRPGQDLVKVVWETREPIVEVVVVAVPTVVRLVAENDLPMLPTGKVDRQGLVRVLTAG
jgi:hypothetical protein